MNRGKNAFVGKPLRVNTHYACISALARQTGIGCVQGAWINSGRELPSTKLFFVHDQCDFRVNKFEFSWPERTSVSADSRCGLYGAFRNPVGYG